MKRMNASERQNQIVDLLSQNGVMKIMDIADHFNVSRETIRRDLIILEDDNRIKKWFGGVISANEHQDFNIQSIEQKIELNTDVKMEICKKALEFIPPQSDIFLGDGSTVLCLAKLLNQTSGHTIITSSVQVVNACIKSNNKVIMCGGMITPLGMSAVGAPTIDFLSSLKTDIAFLGSSGFKLNNGPTGNDFESCNVKTTALKNAQTRILLADSSKALSSSLITFASWDEVDYLITDSNLDSNVKNSISESTKIIFADQ